MLAWRDLDFAGVVVAGLVAGFMGRKTGNPRLALTAFLLHALWGLVIGLVCVPPS